MKLFEQTQTISHPWDVVTQANWVKYPNDISTHVISVDILSREVTSDGVLRTERLLCCEQSAPALLRRLVALPAEAWFREVSLLDPATRTHTATTVNLTMRNIMLVKETCVYREMRGIKEEMREMRASLGEAAAAAAAARDKGLLATLRERGLFSFGSSSSSSSSTSSSSSSSSSTPSSPFTEFIQTAEFHAQIGVSSIKRLLEEAAANRFQANAQKGIRALESVIAKLLNEASETADG
ncbi:PRELI-like family-domain-containing protein [Obelidium mucronatum]|nr:PRELI-like family-domain-containing protein [Obelidium mucronatum]